MGNRGGMARINEMVMKASGKAGISGESPKASGSSNSMNTGVGGGEGD